MIYWEAGYRRISCHVFSRARIYPKTQHKQFLKNQNKDKEVECNGMAQAKRLNT